MITKKFLQEQKKYLLKRKASKQKILKEGGEKSLSHSYKDIVRINFALKRIEEGQYGICVNCGTLIEKGRLAVMPETPFCFSCAKSNEIH